MARGSLVVFFLLAIAAPAAADEDLGRALDAPAHSTRPVSPYAQLSIGGGVQMDDRHDDVHGSVRTRISSGITFPFGLRVGLTTWLSTFYDSASLTAEDVGGWTASTASYGVSGTYLGGLELAFRPAWDPLAVYIGAQVGLGYGEVDVVDEDAFDIRDEGRFAVAVGAHVAAGVAIFENFDLVLRVDVEHVSIGEVNGLWIAASGTVEWH